MEAIVTTEPSVIQILSEIKDIADLLNLTKVEVSSKIVDLGLMPILDSKIIVTTDRVREVTIIHQEEVILTIPPQDKAVLITLHLAQEDSIIALVEDSAQEDSTLAEVYALEVEE